MNPWDQMVLLLISLTVIACKILTIAQINTENTRHVTRIGSTHPDPTQSFMPSVTNDTVNGNLTAFALYRLLIWFETKK